MKKTNYSITYYLNQDITFERVLRDTLCRMSKQNSLNGDILKKDIINRDFSTSLQVCWNEILCLFMR